jgi:hypothetical protein
MEHTGLTLIGELIGRVQAGPPCDEHPRPSHSADVGARGHTPTTDVSSFVKLNEDTQSAFNSLIDEINRVIAPPVPVGADTVFIRAMEVLSDEINDHGGRFAADEFPRLCELLIDSPVLVAHDKRQLPVARNFKAEVISRDGRPWVKVWFYWPKNAAGAQDLAARIDSGVLREVSIGFEFKRPECSVCGADIRECEHQPATEVKHPDGSIRQVHYIYRDIVRVLETSLVYRGATPGTRIGAGLFFDKVMQPLNFSAMADGNDSLLGQPPDICRLQVPRSGNHPHLHSLINRLFDTGLAGGMPVGSTTDILAADDSLRRFIVLPLIEGLPVVAVKRDDEVLVFDADQKELGAKISHIRSELARTMADDFGCFGWLVRSGSGRDKTEVTLFADGIGSLADENHLSHLIIDHRHLLKRIFDHGKLVRPVPYRFVDRGQLARATHILSSSAGCSIYPGGAAVSSSPVFYELRRQKHLWLQIVGREVAPDGKWRYRLALADGDDVREILPAVVSAQRYQVGHVVPVNGSLTYSPARGFQLADATIRYTPARRRSADTVAAVRRACIAAPIGTVTLA